jgi:small subunit ribosomal protein S10
MLLDKSAEKIVKTVKSTGAVVTGPIPYNSQKNFYSATFSAR